MVDKVTFYNRLGDPVQVDDNQESKAKMIESGFFDHDPTKVVAVDEVYTSKKKRKSYGFSTPNENVESED